MKTHHHLKSLLAGACALMTMLMPQSHAAGFLDSIKTALAGEYVVRGRVQVQDGQWLTCFNGINTGYLGPANLARPGSAETNPATGNIQVSTAAIPTIILTRDGTVTSNSLATQNLLVADSAAAPSGGGNQSDTGYHDPQGCTDPSWTKDEVVLRRREIMECQAEAITERAYQRAQARSQAAQGTAAPGGGFTTGTSAVERQAAVAKLQEDTAAKFAAIQAQGAMPAAAPAQSDEDLAWDGAKLCGLKPAYMMKLKDEAVQFVRIDNTADRIILSEIAGGARQEVAVDGNGFAQRSMFNATAIGQGGDTCGRAFWSAEAYKAASAAMSR
jgi:hypothetical protein